MKPDAIRNELLNLKASLSLGMSKVDEMLQQFEKKERKSNTATLNKILAKRRKTLIK